MSVIRDLEAGAAARDRRGLALILLPYLIAVAVVLLGRVRLMGAAGEAVAVGLVLAIPTATVLALLVQVVARGPDAPPTRPAGRVGHGRGASRRAQQSASSTGRVEA